MDTLIKLQCLQKIIYKHLITSVNTVNADKMMFFPIFKKCSFLYLFFNREEFEAVILELMKKPKAKVTLNTEKLVV